MTRRDGSIRRAVEGLETRRLLAVTYANIPFGPATATPAAIVAGVNGTLAYTVPGDGGLRGAAIGLVDAASGAVAAFATPDPAAGLGAIVAGPMHDYWFVDNDAAAKTAAIGRFDPVSKQIVEFPLDVAGAQLSGLAATADGRLDFTDASNASLGTFDPATGKVAEVALSSGPSRDYPAGIVAAPNGLLYFTYGSGYGRFDPTAGTFAEYSTGALPKFAAIAVGPAGQVVLATSYSYFDELNQGHDFDDFYGADPVTGSPYHIGQLSLDGGQGRRWSLSRPGPTAPSGRLR